ncbi:MAG: DUF1778 domain-containing protein [Alcanivorax sp.]|nr:DUF1778 domain-containing protein [Alcanivorax sp.]
MSSATKDKAAERRLVARTNADVHQRIADAADLLGATVSQFLIDSALERANRVTQEATRLRVSRDAFVRMMTVLDQPANPAPRLQQAAHRYREVMSDEHPQKDPERDTDAKP